MKFFSKKLNAYTIIKLLMTNHNFHYLEEEKSGPVTNENPKIDFYDGLNSSKFETYMYSVLKILKLAKKKKFEEIIKKDVVENLITEKGNLQIANKFYIYRCLYYMTDIDENPKYLDVWKVIFKHICIVFHEREVSPHEFKIICKIVSNFLMGAKDDEVAEFVNNDFDFITQRFIDNLNDAAELKEDYEINESGYICQGCLRIFSALCNQYESIIKIKPDLIDRCIKPFIDALQFKNKYLKNTTIKYMYYITNWSPSEVISGLANRDFIGFLFDKITNKDEKKNCLSFYSTLILLSFSKLHDGGVADILFSFKPYDINISDLPTHSRNYYVRFLFSIAQTDEKYADYFIKSQSFLSIIQKGESNDIDDILDGVNSCKFMKYMSCLYSNFPIIRDPFISLIANNNPICYFVSFLTHADIKYISAAIICIDDIIQKINSNSEVGKELKNKLYEERDDIFDDIQSTIEDLNENADSQKTMKEKDMYIKAMEELKALDERISKLLETSE